MRKPGTRWDKNHQQPAQTARKGGMSYPVGKERSKNTADELKEDLGDRWKISGRNEAGIYLRK